MTLRTHTYAEPRAHSGYVEFEWNKLEDAPIVCFLEYEPAEDGRLDHPSYPENVTLCEAWLFGVDLMPLLTDDQVEEIEIAYLTERESAAGEAAIDRFIRQRDNEEIWT